MACNFFSLFHFYFDSKILASVKNFISNTNSNENNPKLNSSQNKNDYMKNDMLKVVNKIVKNNEVQNNKNQYYDTFLDAPIVM